MEFTAAKIAGLLKGEIEGNPDIKVNTIAKIEEGHEGALSFLANPKYEHYIYSTGSSIDCGQEKVHLCGRPQRVSAELHRIVWQNRKRNLPPTLAD